MPLPAPSAHQPDVLPRYVFVYGTLRKGDDNDITCLQPSPRFVGLAHVRGTLYHLGQYPGLRLEGSTKVVGEVYEITSDLEKVLDEIEFIYPQQSDEYFKKSIAVQVAGGRLDCLVYVINPSYALGKPVLAGGDWVREREGL